jgi:hypothetical protein
MSRNTIVVLIHHRHRLLVLIDVISIYSPSINPIESTVSCGCGDRPSYITTKNYSCHPFIIQF